MASWKKVIVSGSDAELNGLTLSGDLTVSGGDITLGSTSIFSGGDTTSLNNIDALDATTEATIESALDTLSNVTTVGTLNAGSSSSGFGNINNGTSTLNTGNATVDNLTNASAVADSHITGSFTGSFSGDGSNLTGVAQDIELLSAYGAGTLHQTQDKFLVSDNGTEKSITFSNLEDSIFANVSGDATLAAGGALTIAADSVENSMLANITRGSIKVGGGSNAPTDLDAKTSGQILVGDGTDIASVAVSGDIALASNGAMTIQANSVALATDTTGDYVQNITAGTGISSTGATSGENIAHTLNVDMSGLSSATIGAGTSEVTIGDNLTINGDLTIYGDTVQQQVSNLLVEDKFVFVSASLTLRVSIKF